MTLKDHASAPFPLSSEARSRALSQSRLPELSACADGLSKANAPATPPTMGKDKKSKGGGFSSPASGDGLAAALGHGTSPRQKCVAGSPTQTWWGGAGPRQASDKKTRLRAVSLNRV